MLLFLQLTNKSGIRNDVKECLAWVMFCFMLDQEHFFASQVISIKSTGVLYRLCVLYPPILTTFPNIPIPTIECLAVGYGISGPKEICTKMNCLVFSKCLLAWKIQSQWNFVLSSCAWSVIAGETKQYFAIRYQINSELRNGLIFLAHSL